MQQSIAPPFRRQFERRTSNANAFLHHRGCFQRAKIVDYSAGGLRLEGTFGLVKADAVQIEFISGTRVAARVAWSLGAQTGIVFSEPLQTNHPAMSQLSRCAVRESVLE